MGALQNPPIVSSSRVDQAFTGTQHNTSPLLCSFVKIFGIGIEIRVDESPTS